MHINHQDLLTDLEKFIKEKQQGDNFNAGMIAVYQYLEKYKPQSTFVLNDEFKQFALENFLDNDETKLPKFQSVIQLFSLLYKNVDPLSSWNDGPNDLDYTMFNNFSDILNNYTLQKFSQDWDHSWLELSVVYKKENGQLIAHSFDTYGKFDGKQDNNARDMHYKLCEFLNIKGYESLFLTINLLVAFDFMDQDKINQKILEQKPNIQLSSFKAK